MFRVHVLTIYILYVSTSIMPRKSRHAEAEPSPETYTTLSPEDPDAWPRLVAFDLEQVTFSSSCGFGFGVELIVV